MLTAKALNVINGRLGQEFEQLFHEHYPMVYRTAYSVTGSREDSAEKPLGN
jgi:DNA-directed RNA polymerase specialized sigma24 family protein